MLVTTIDLLDIAPGGFLHWQPLASGAPVPSAAPLTANQLFHLDHLRDRSTPATFEGWLAVSFDVPGRINVAALTESFAALLERHEILRCFFTVTPTSAQCAVYPHEAIQLSPPRQASPTSTPLEMRTLLAHTLRHTCDPTRFPSALFAAIDRSDTSTIVCGFDHAYVDSLSLAIINRELHADYLARCSGQRPTPLPTTGSFLEYCRFVSQLPAPRDDHPGLLLWRNFLQSQQGKLPTFPLDLEVSPGDIPPQQTRVQQLLSSTDAERCEKQCKDAGGHLFSGELSALASAVSALGGPDHYAILSPLHTRLRPEWTDAVGWFVTNIPLIISTGTDFAAHVQANRDTLVAAMPAAEIPIGSVLEGAAGPCMLPHKDVSMVSHINYHRVFASPDYTPRGSTHISNSSVADDVQFWFSRTSEGLWLRTRFPSTLRANTLMPQLEEIVSDTLSRQW